MVSKILVAVIAFSLFFVGETHNFYSVQRDTITTYKYYMSFMVTNNRDSINPNPNNQNIKNAIVNVIAMDKRVLRLRIRDSEKQRWEVPMFNTESGKKYKRIPFKEMGFSLGSDPQTFEFKIVDPVSQEKIIDFSLLHDGNFQFFDKLIEMEVSIPGSRIYGLGERTTLKFELCTTRSKCTYGLWGQDIHTPVDEGEGKMYSAYSQHPFYVVQLAKSKLFLGILNYNSNSQEVTITKFGQTRMNVNHRTIGGIINIKK